jgi:putative phosphoribosyl transferase
MDAGEQLAIAVRADVDGPALILGIPRGGVIVAEPVARALEAPLDIVVPRKLGAPGNPELAVGAVAQGIRVFHERTIRELAIDRRYLDEEAARQQLEIERRTAAYRDARPAPEIAGRTVVVVDDGVATGATAIAALRWARSQAPGRVLFAAPVGPSGVQDKMETECDRCIVLQTPAHLRAVGQWYERFEQVTDDEVRHVLGGG